jgi:hypothetical protein
VVVERSTMMDNNDELGRVATPRTSLQPSRSWEVSTRKSVYIEEADPFIYRLTCTGRTSK